MLREPASKKYEKFTISFTDADVDIIKHINELKLSGKASEFIREAIREKIEGEVKDETISETIADLDDRMKLLEKSFRNGQKFSNIDDNSANNEINRQEVIVNEEKAEALVAEKTKEIDEALNNALDFFN